MAENWYFAVGGQTTGPVAFDEVAQRVRSTPDTLVWREGLDQWTPARHLTDFDHVMKAAPPPLPPPLMLQPADGVAPPIVPKPHPWRRFFARYFDNFFFGVITVTALEFAFPLTFNDKTSDQLVGIAAVALFIPIEAVLLLAFGRSLGKALYGINLKPSKEFDFSTALKRSVLVWWKGLGAGIPIVSLFTALTAHKRLVNSGSTTWDAEMGITVSYSRLSFVRWLLVAFCWLVIIVIIFVGAASN